jgi:hypothetical protein
MSRVFSRVALAVSFMTALSACQSDADETETPDGGGGGETGGGGGGGETGGGGGEIAGGSGGEIGSGGAPTCADYTRDPIVLGGSRSAGECLGACRFDLTIEADELADSDVACDLVRLTMCESPAGEPCVENVGTLTPAAHVLARSAAAAVLDVSLDAQYGCPGCADGLVHSLDLRRDGEETNHRYELEDRPESLAPADDLVQGLIEALRSCTDSALVEVRAGCVVIP